jgi:hypothetical protein
MVRLELAARYPKRELKDCPEAVNLCIADCIADCVWLAVPRMAACRSQIDAASIGSEQPVSAQIFENFIPQIPDSVNWEDIGDSEILGMPPREIDFTERDPNARV